MNVSLPSVSLFTNCGAGDLGYARAGFTFRVMAELEARRLAVALKNHPDAQGVPGDLRETWGQVVETYRQAQGSTPPALLAACPPCQGMSSARGDRGDEDDPDAGSADRRNLLVRVIADVADALNPRSIVVENVRAFLTRKVRHPDTGSAVSAARLLIESLEDRYAVFPLLTDLADHGVPQTRIRSFLTFVRADEPGLRRLQNRARSPYPRPTHGRGTGRPHVTLSAALEGLGLPPLDSRQATTARSDRYPLHHVSVLGDRHYRMVAAIPSDSGRGAWSNDRCLECDAVVDDSEAAECHNCCAILPRPVVVRPGSEPRLVKGFRSSSYTRMSPDKPAATITTASGNIGSDKTLHPTENRVLSVAECAHLQTIPSDFDWGEGPDYGTGPMRAMVGEAVPPHFTEQHGRILASLLLGRRGWGAPPLTVHDNRVLRARSKLDMA